MTYRFFCRYFRPWVAALITALWFALLLVIIFIFSGYSEGAFVYINF